MNWTDYMARIRLARRMRKFHKFDKINRREIMSKMLRLHIIRTTNSALLVQP